MGSLSTRCLCDTYVQGQWYQKAPSLFFLGAVLFWRLNLCVLCCVWGFIIYGLWVGQVSRELVCARVSWFIQIMVWGPMIQWLTLHLVMQWFLIQVPSCFIKFPVCQVSGDIPESLHLLVSSVFRAFKCPCRARLEDSRVVVCQCSLRTWTHLYYTEHSCDSRGVGPSWLRIHSTLIFSILLPRAKWECFPEDLGHSITAKWF